MPHKPINTPIICVLLKATPKNKPPSSSVFKGVNEFKIELTELLICVWAKANKKAGKNVPKKAVNAINFHLWSGMVGKDLNPRINKKIEEKMIRNEPNWNGDKATNPFFNQNKWTSPNEC